MKWQHRVERRSANRKITPSMWTALLSSEEEAAWLDSVGAEGWELVSVTHVDDAESLTHYYFRRPVPDETPFRSG